MTKMPKLFAVCGLDMIVLASHAAKEDDAYAARSDSATAELGRANALNSMILRDRINDGECWLDEPYEGSDGEACFVSCRHDFSRGRLSASLAEFVARLEYCPYAVSGL